MSVTDDEKARFLFDAMKIFQNDEEETTGWTLQAEEKRRYEICKACPFYAAKEVGEEEQDKTIAEYCKVCGCLVTTKISYPLEKCPGNLWTEHYESFRKTTYESLRTKLSGDA